MKKTIIILTILLGLMISNIHVLASNKIIDTSNIEEGKITINYEPTVKTKVSIQKYGNDRVLHNHYETKTYNLVDGVGVYTINIYQLKYGTMYTLLYSKIIMLDVDLKENVFLGSNNEIIITNDIIELSNKIVSNSELEPHEAIYTYIKNNLSYDVEALTLARANNYRFSNIRTLDTQKGICGDYATLYASLMRVQNIPTKLVEGYANGGKTRHAWNECYINNEWLTIDTSTLDILDFDTIVNLGEYIGVKEF